MPREASFRCSVIGELYRQLQWSSEDARVRLLEAAELLMREIDDDRAYPVAFVIFRLTSWKLDDQGVMESVTGAALRADLVTMIQRGSRRIPLAPGEVPGLIESTGLTAKALGVSSRTLVRLRPLGLVMRYCRADDGHVRLACTPDALDWFRANRKAVIKRVDAPGRGRPDAVAIEDHARALPPARTLEFVVRRVARDTGESAGTVRGVLQRARRRGTLDLATESRLGSRDRRLLLRAARRGITTSHLASRLGVAVSSVHRALLRGRAARITAVDMLIPPAAVDHDATEQEALNESSETGFGLPGVSVSLEAGPGLVTDPADDLLAMHVLRRRLAVQVRGFPVQPIIGQVDRAETDLRWMTVLRWRVMLGVFPEAIHAVEAWCDRDPRMLPGDVQRRTLREALMAVRDVVAIHRADEIHRLAPRVRAAVDRAVLRISVPRGDLAEARLPRLPELPLHEMESWQDLLPDPRWSDAVHGLPRELAQLLEHRWGLAGEAPRTVGELADRAGRDPSAMARSLASAQRRLQQVVQSFHLPE